MSKVVENIRVNRFSYIVKTYWIQIFLTCALPYCKRICSVENFAQLFYVSVASCLSCAIFVRSYPTNYQTAWKVFAAVVQSFACITVQSLKTYFSWAALYLSLQRSCVCSESLPKRWCSRLTFKLKMLRLLKYVEWAFGTHWSWRLRDAYHLKYLRTAWGLWRRQKNPLVKNNCKCLFCYCSTSIYVHEGQLLSVV